MNFTKDYISLCKNEKVQGLRPEFYTGDVIYMSYVNQWQIVSYDIDKTKSLPRFEGWVWLPTGDQLDQHIIEQLDDGSDYTFIYTNFSKEAGHYNAIVYEGGEVKEQIIYEENPLICKLKLLISLLKEE
jgi:hypothetical protein